MKSLSLKALKNLPLHLVVPIIAVILIFSAVVPQYRKLSDTRSELEKEVHTLNKYKSALNNLKTLPEFQVFLESKDDIILSLRKVIESSNLRMADITESSDNIGRFVSFTIDATGYRSVSTVITFLENLRMALPVIYTGYTLKNKSITVNTKCYINK